MSTSSIPWSQLRELARTATTLSYAPYSHVTVGAAAITDSGVIVTGSNVENASYGLTLCAECSLTSDLIRQGGGRLIGIAIVAGDGQPLAPCGRCRQVLFEHGGRSLIVDDGSQSPTRTISDLLPDAFGPDDLDTRSN